MRARSRFSSSAIRIPESVSTREVLGGAFGPHAPDANGPHDVIVEFTATKVQLVASHEWHPTQHLTTLSDGRVRIAFRAPSLAPIVSWVLEWGPHARVIAPEPLIRSVVRELDGARAQYTQPIRKSTAKAGRKKSPRCRDREIVLVDSKQTRVVASSGSRSRAHRSTAAFSSSPLPISMATHVEIFAGWGQSRDHMDTKVGAPARARQARRGNRDSPQDLAQRGRIDRADARQQGGDARYFDSSTW